MRRKIVVLPVALAAASLLGGCGFMHKHFSHKDADYSKAPQERPLEIPPDLDTPNTTGALVVPSVAAPSVPASSASTPAGVSSAPPQASIASGVQIGGDGLRVADSVDSTWTRVGLALDRSGAAKVLSRDEAAHVYAVQTTGQATTQASWFKRALTLGHATGKTTANVQLTVRVSADGAGSRVSVEGATDDASQDAARALLATLRQRLS